MMSTATLDSRIVDSSSFVAILLVFVFAFFSALFTQIETARARPTPEVAADKRALSRQLRNYQWMAGGLIAVNLGVLLVMLPLTWQVLTHMDWTNVLRSSLIFANFLMLVTIAALVAEVVLMLQARALLK
jgi:CBS domain containing-hemolysin-like protein